MFQKGGTIVPRKDRPRRSSVLMHNDPYTLVVALGPGVIYFFNNKKMYVERFCFAECC